MLRRMVGIGGIADMDGLAPKRCSSPTGNCQRAIIPGARQFGFAVAELRKRLAGLPEQFGRHLLPRKEHNFRRRNIEPEPAPKRKLCGMVRED